MFILKVLKSRPHSFATLKIALGSHANFSLASEIYAINENTMWVRRKSGYDKPIL